MAEVLGLLLELLEILEPLKKNGGTKFEIVDHLVSLVLEVLVLLSEVLDLPLLTFNDLEHLLLAHVVVGLKGHLSGGGLGRFLVLCSYYYSLPRS